MQIINCTEADIPTLFQLYDVATAYQKTRYSMHWLGFEQTMVETEIQEKRQWKIIENGEIACVFVITWNDPAIWKEKDNDPAIYIHRIAVNPSFRGRQYVKQIVAWAKTYAQENGKRFVRLDTHSGNEKLNAHYISCGFTYLGIHQLANSASLPAHYQQGLFSLFELEIS